MSLSKEQQQYIRDQNIQVLCKRCNGIKSSIPHERIRQIAKWIVLINKERKLRGKPKPFACPNEEVK